MKYITFLLLLSVLLVTGCEASPAEPGMKEPAILFQDDFSNLEGRWDHYQDEYGATQYSQGAYRIFVNTPDTDLWANPDKLVFTDAQIVVEARQVGGSKNNIFGIICRYQNAQNFYQLLVSSDGYYDISKVKDNLRVPLTGEQLLPSDLIPQEAELLHLRADCVGDRLTLFVENVQIASAEDSDFSSGNIGLIAGAYEVPGTDIFFDNLVVWRP